MECSAARGIHDVMCDVFLHKMVATFSNEKKLYSRDQVVAIAEGVPNLTTATTKTTGEMLGIVKIREN